MWKLSCQRFRKQGDALEWHSGWRFKLITDYSSIIITVRRVRVNDPPQGKACQRLRLGVTNFMWRPRPFDMLKRLTPVRVWNQKDFRGDLRSIHGTYERRLYRRIFEWRYSGFSGLSVCHLLVQFVDRARPFLCCLGVKNSRITTISSLPSHSW